MGGYIKSARKNYKLLPTVEKLVVSVYRREHVTSYAENYWKDRDFVYETWSSSMIKKHVQKMFL